jgi:hypothetical protein
VESDCSVGADAEWEVFVGWLQVIVEWVGLLTLASLAAESIQSRLK